MEHGCRIFFSRPHRRLVPAIWRHVTDGRLQWLNSTPTVLKVLRAYEWPASRIARVPIARACFEGVGQNVRKYRKRPGLTQEELARKAKLHPIYISQVERADRAVTLNALLKITRALRVKLRHVVGNL